MASASSISSLLYSFGAFPIAAIMAAIPWGFSCFPLFPCLSEDPAAFSLLAFIPASIFFNASGLAPIDLAISIAFSGSMLAPIFFMASFMLSGIWPWGEPSLETDAGCPLPAFFSSDCSLFADAAIIIAIIPFGALRSASIWRALASSCAVIPAVRQISSSVASAGLASNFSTRWRAGVKYCCVKRLRCLLTASVALPRCLSRASRLYAIGSVAIA